MKKSFALIVLLSVFFFVGCSSQPSPEPKEEISKEKTVDITSTDEVCNVAGEMTGLDTSDGSDLGTCCEGLTEISGGTKESYDESCAPTLGIPAICSDCGNETCEGWENECNCPGDCIHKKK